MTLRRLLVLSIVFAVMAVFAIPSVLAQDPTATPEATAEPADTSATAEAGDTGGQTAGPPFVCDTTTLTLLLVAESYGFSESQFGSMFNLADYDLGDARAFFDAIQPTTETRLDDVMADEAMAGQVDTFMSQFDMEGEVTQLEDISVTEEDPNCLTLRQAAQQFVLLNLVIQQMQLQGSSQ